MNKNTINYMMGVIFGFIGIMLYSFALTGYEHVGINSVINFLKEATIPFLFTELWVAITSEGVRNMVVGFKGFVVKLEAKRLAKKIMKEEQA